MTMDLETKAKTGRPAGCSGAIVLPTPILLSGWCRNLLLLAVLGALVAVAWYAPAVPLVAVGGFALALTLSFPVRLLSRLMPRGLAIALSFSLLAGLVVLGI